MKNKILAIIVSCLMITSSTAVLAVEDEEVIKDPTIEEIEATPAPTPTEVIIEEIDVTKKDEEIIHEPSQVEELQITDDKTNTVQDEVITDHQKEWVVDEAYTNYIAMNDEEQADYLVGLTPDQQNRLMEYINEQENQINDEPLSVEQLYESYLACENDEDKVDYFDGLSKEQQGLLQTFIDSKANETSDDIEEVAEIIITTDDTTLENTAVNFSDAGSLLAPVAGNYGPMPAPQRSMSINDSGFIVDKKVNEIPNEQGEYTLTMEAYTEKEVQQTTTIPSDIIMVLDQSGSMDEKFNGSTLTNKRIYKYGDSKQKALQEISANFIVDLSVADNHSKVALINFGDKTIQINTNYSDNYGGAFEWDNNQYPYDDYVHTTKNDYDSIKMVQGRFINTGVEGELVHTILNLPITLSSTGTYMMAPLNQANKKLSDNIKTIPSGEKRNQVVILVSDGIPNDDKDDIVQKAKAIKDKGATLYVVGIFSSADPNAKDSKNNFMNYISSNYPNATSMNDTVYERVDQSENYYLSAKDIDGLSAIFKNIEEEVSKPSGESKTEFTMKDVVTDYFKLPENIDEANVTLNKVECTGFDETLGKYIWGELTSLSTDGLTYDPDAKTVSVSGFDFDENHVSKVAKSDGSYGYKLSLSFNVSIEDGFMGGNNVPTNKDTSGIYEIDPDKEPTFIEPFPIPVVDIQPTLNVKVKDQSIYLGNSLKNSDLFNKTYPKFDGVHNAFIDTTFKMVADVNDNGFIDKDDEIVNEWEVKHHQSANEALCEGEISPENKTQYLLEYQMTPIDASDDHVCGSDVQIKNTSFFIHVLKPTIDFHDVYVDYGISVDFINDCADGNLAYTYDENKNIDSLVVDGTTKQPLDNKNDLLSNDGHYLIDDQGNHLNKDASSDAIANATVSTKRPSSITWIDEETGTSVVPLADGQMPPVVTYHFKNLSDKSYTAKDYYNQRCKEEEQFYPYQFTTQTTTNDKVEHTYALSEDQKQPFNIHLNTYDLIIEKTIEKDAINKYRQDMIFNISYELNGKLKEIQVVLPADDFIENQDGSYTIDKTIEDLYAGLAIVINEDNDWSWRTQLNLGEIDRTDNHNLLETHMTLNNADLSVELFAAYSKNYAGSLSIDGAWNNITNWTDLVRKVGTRVPSSPTKQGVVTIEVNNVASEFNDDWMSDRNFARNIFKRNEVSE